MNYSEFSGGDEANNFLISLGFNIINKIVDDDIKNQMHDFAPKLKEYLERTYFTKIDKSEGRARFSFRSSAIIHVRGSKILDGIISIL